MIGRTPSAWLALLASRVLVLIERLSSKRADRVQTDTLRTAAVVRRADRVVKMLEAQAKAARGGR